MYTKNQWVNGRAGNTPLNATRLNIMEQGIEQSDITNPDSDAREYLDDRLNSLPGGGGGEGPSEGVGVTTGNQTFQGVKTFQSSPVVPTPVSNSQAASKGYVDSAVAGVGGANPTRIETYSGPAGARVETKIVSGEGVVEVRAGDTSVVARFKQNKVELTDGSIITMSESDGDITASYSASIAEFTGRTNPDDSPGTERVTSMDHNGVRLAAFHPNDFPYGIAGQLIFNVLTNRVMVNIDNDMQWEPLPLASGTSMISVGADAPSSPAVGDLWVDTN